MSAIGESVGRRMTLGYLVSHYGYELTPSFATNVTITSIANDLGSVRPGSLYIPFESIDVHRLEQAHIRGAYAAMIPHTMRGLIEHVDFPLLFAEPTEQQLGALASDLAGDPANMLAVFAVSGADSDEVQANVVRLADFLHMLGNPVGVVSAAGSTSLERSLDVTYPLGIFDMQHILSICGEDGAAAVVLSMDPTTLRQDALQSVNIDVLGDTDVLGADDDTRTRTEALRRTFGFTMDAQAHLITRNQESDVFAEQSQVVHDSDGKRRLSLSVAMVLAAGVRRNNIKSALRVSQELS